MTLFKDATWMDEELLIMSDGVRKFFEAELLPNVKKFDEERCYSREFWQKAGDNGVLCASIPEEYGGLGGTFAHEAVIFGELGQTGEVGFGLHVHNIAIHYILSFATEEQKKRWLPRLATGELIAGICMTEPGTGSDLQAVRTKALRDGNDYIINGSKTFISNGQVGNFYIVVTKTDPSQGGRGISLFGVETDGLEGFRRGQNLEKLGMKSQDTSELFFDDMRVNSNDLIGGEEGQGFSQLMNELSWERLMLGIIAVGVSAYALKETISYTTDRKVFGKAVIDFQNSRFKLAEAKTKIEILKAFIEKSINKLLVGELSASEASMAKWWGSQVQNEVVDECLQLHGGYGYMMEYPIAKLYADSRVQKIYGGTNEIMKELIARTLQE